MTKNILINKAHKYYFKKKEMYTGSISVIYGPMV